MTHFPDPALWQPLHERLLHDMTVQAALCDLYLAPLTAALQRAYPSVHPHACATAASDALLDYLRQPERFAPQRGSLNTYLYRIAECDLCNLLAAESRRRQREAGQIVELDHLAGNTPAEDPPLLRLVRAEEFAAERAYLDRIRAEASDDERAVLDLLLAGERTTRAYALVLGIADLPVAEQEKRVKREKDRVKKRILRGGIAHG